MSHETLYIWTIYDHPTDHPNNFIARKYFIRMGKHSGTSGPTGHIYTGHTLEEVRKQLPPGLNNIGRQEDDDSKIVESWV